MKGWKLKRELGESNHNIIPSFDGEIKAQGRVGVLC